MSDYIPARGDRVRVAIEGVVTDSTGGPVFAVGATTVEKLDEPEPPAGSVVIDSEGDAWQRGVNGWFVSQGLYGGMSSLTWLELARLNGPLKVVYTP